MSEETETEDNECGGETPPEDDEPDGTDPRAELRQRVREVNHLSLNRPR